RSERSRAIAVGIVAGSALVSAFLWGPLPGARHPVHAADRTFAPTIVAGIDPVRRAIPPHAVISAYYSFTTHVAHRERIYLWPTPFFAQHWRSADDNGRRLPAADDVEYLLLPPQLDDHPEVLASLSSQFTEIARSDGAVLYRRVTNGSAPSAG
ncbi:MAG TPA: hypothetical protein VFR41_13150, partial [Acidimicrobiia bacterium]|nr:hypothetical protein [Acidimicrobiia bacterium]